MNEQKLRLILIGGALLLLVLIIAALWVVTGSIPNDALRVWAVIATLVLVPLFFAGFYFGKVEARGVLHGFDQSLDRLTSVVSNIITVRDQSRTSMHRATQPQAGYGIPLPTMKELNTPITHRANAGDVTIDL